MLARRLSNAIVSPMFVGGLAVAALLLGAGMVARVNAAAPASPAAVSPAIPETPVTPVSPGKIKEYPAKTLFKFDFGSGKAAEGYTKVEAGNVYSKQAGFGFEAGKGGQPKAVGTGGAMTDDYITAPGSLYFSVAVPEGNYKVTVTFGDKDAATQTTVKAELRRLMLEGVHTAKGEFVTKSFMVNVRVPQIAGGGSVKINGRETSTETWAWDDKLSLEFCDSRPAVCGVEIARVDDLPTVFILGDSTVCDQPTEQYCSWGQMLTRFIKPEFAVANHAESGESVAGSNGAQRFAKILSQMKKGDYFFVQFGHNDMKAANAGPGYLSTLKKWADQTKAKGATPVIVTPVSRRSFSGNVVTQSLKEFPDLAKQAAKESGAAMIDLNEMSKVMYESLGANGAKVLFKSGDDTHHCNYGAYELAKCIVQGIKDNKLDLANSIVDDFTTFNPAKVDPIAGFKVPASGLRSAEAPLGS